MRYLRYGFYAVLMVTAVLIALANRGAVTLSLLPDQLSGLVSLSIDMPLFVVIFLSVLAGILIGQVLEWFREHKIRKKAVQHRREAETLAREVDTLKKEAGKEEDEILALLK